MLGRRVLFWLVTLSAVCLGPVTQAATLQPLLIANVSGETAIDSSAVPLALRTPITVTRNDAPLRAAVSGYGGDTFTSFFGPGNDRVFHSSVAAEGAASATPGVLRVFGANRANAPPLQLIAGGPSNPNPNYHYARIFADAYFVDYLTVDVAGLPLGTPVQVPFMYLVEAVSDYTLGFPQFGDRPIKFSGSFSVSGYPLQTYDSDRSFGRPVETLLDDGLRLYTVRSRPFEVSAKVGDVLTISAQLTVEGRANIYSPLDGLSTYGGFVDARNTAALWLAPLPAGMTLVSASGHDYRIDPTAATVPLPAAGPLLFGVLGWLGLRRRRIRPGAVQGTSSQ